MSEGGAACLARFRARAGLPRPCRVERDGRVLAGSAIDVDGDGALLLRDGDGLLHRVVSGEIAALP